jgi:hypothetical protein
MYVLINIEGMSWRKGGGDINPVYAFDTWVFPSNESDGLHLRVFKRLGFTPPFAWRASYFRANLSEDCYAPCRVLHDWKQERYFHSDILDYHSEGIFIHVIVIKSFSSQYRHLSDIKCELKIMTLLEFMYIYIGTPMHFQRQVQKGVKEWNKNHLWQNIKNKKKYCWMKKIIPVKRYF